MSASESLKWRKKPVVIEAVRFDGTLASVEAMNIPEASQELGSRTLEIPTLEGTMTAQPGDWIIRGVQGEFYPCKPDIFAATYEPADAPIYGEAAELRAENERLRAQLSRTPDHAYDKDEWEYTVPWHERDILNDAALNSNGVVRIGTLLDGPDWFIANVPVTFDEDGCPDEREVRWFATREEAEAALAATEEQP